ncbi:hypothetical protein Tasa_009_046 [Tanticharoenia sakaeratensis NBRC 103193]|uniref:Uncharacterized protein n=1 Tax=Tanticharoenia sakaeratensis NBRC 103193 TaxID=1231623 RepID=A0A0D6MIE4_9PROT|nr:hypothetical protein Tasa_009_046 [Tanticharoenia sakaeratensis NBRC 103193]
MIDDFAATGAAVGVDVRVAQAHPQPGIQPAREILAMTGQYVLPERNDITDDSGFNAVERALLFRKRLGHERVLAKSGDEDRAKAAAVRNITRLRGDRVMKSYSPSCLVHNLKCSAIAEPAHK